LATTTAAPARRALPGTVTKLVATYLPSLKERLLQLVGACPWDSSGGLASQVLDSPFITLLEASSCLLERQKLHPLPSQLVLLDELRAMPSKRAALLNSLQFAQMRREAELEPLVRYASQVGWPGVAGAVAGLLGGSCCVGTAGAPPGTASQRAHLTDAHPLTSCPLPLPCCPGSVELRVWLAGRGTRRLLGAGAGIRRAALRQ
jgi:hypothetical protein